MVHLACHLARVRNQGWLSGLGLGLGLDILCHSTTSNAAFPGLGTRELLPKKELALINQTSHQDLILILNSGFQFCFWG
jgi:hypothetical protein